MTASTNVKHLSKTSSLGVTMHVARASHIADTLGPNRRTLIRAHKDQLARDFDDWLSIVDDGVEFHKADSLPYGCSANGLAADQQRMHGMFEVRSVVIIDFDEFLYNR